VGSLSLVISIGWDMLYIVEILVLSMIGCDEIRVDDLLLYLTDHAYTLYIFPIFFTHRVYIFSSNIHYIDFHAVFPIVPIRYLDT